MARVKRGVQANRRHKKVLARAKGYYGARSRVFRVAVQAVTKAGQYAYRDRPFLRADSLPPVARAPAGASSGFRDGAGRG